VSKKNGQFKHPEDSSSVGLGYATRFDLRNGFQIAHLFADSATPALCSINENLAVRFSPIA
jgi:hypothetical protein